MDSSAGAFKGWYVLLCVGSSVKQHGFKRMLEAGSGKVGTTHPPFKNLDGVTHAFIGENAVYFETYIASEYSVSVVSLS